MVWSILAESETNVTTAHVRLVHQNSVLRIPVVVITNLRGLIKIALFCEIDLTIQDVFVSLLSHVLDRHDVSKGMVQCVLKSGTVVHLC